jgi:opacity protein-like surface antigen
MRTSGVALALMLIGTTVGAAQRAGLREVRPWGDLGFSVVGGVPVGQFGDLVSGVGGVNADLNFRFDRRGSAALRIDGSYLQYGNERRFLPLAGSGGLLAVDMNTTFYVAALRAGPQVLLGEGRIRPYGFGTIGVAYFATQTSLGGCCGTTNFDDTALSLAAGGGLRIDLSRGRHPAALDLGASFVQNGQVSYLREGDILPNPDGSFTLRPVRSDANFVTLQLGLSFALR